MMTKKAADNLKSNSTKPRGSSSSQLTEPSQPTEAGFFKPKTVLHAESASQTQSKRTPKTSITVKYNVGFGNALYLRGEGAHLSWNKGLPLKNVREDEWTWETESSFTDLKFKVLINDSVYETGDNHALRCGEKVIYAPKFH